MQHVQEIVPAKLPLRVALGWASGSLAMSIMYQATNVLLLRYLVDFMGITAALAGAMIGGSKLFDAFIDPLIGAASDRTRSRWGRRRPYLFVGGLLCSVAFTAIFAMPPIADQTVRDLIAEIALVMLAVGYGVFNIPYIAMPAEMDISRPERTRLMSFRITAVSLGGMAAVFLGPILIAWFGGGRTGHTVMGVIVGVIILVSAIGCFWFTREAPVRAIVPTRHHGFAEQFRLAMGNRPFFLLMLVKLLTLFGAGLFGAVQPFLYLLKLKSNYSVMGIAFLVSSIFLILSQPMWVRVARRTGVKRLYMITTPLSCLVMLSWLLAGAGQPVAFIMLRSVIGGMLGGASLLTLQAMLPETIEYDYRRTGLRREGVFSGVYTTVEKLSAALAASAVGLLLASFGYVASTTGGATQSPEVLKAITMCIIVSAVLSLLSVFVIRNYRIDEI